jgi:hypothetical protein
MKLQKPFRLAKTSNRPRNSSPIPPMMKANASVRAKVAVFHFAKAWKISMLGESFVSPMNCRSIPGVCACVALLLAAAAAQTAPSGQPEVAAPASYASVSQLNTMLAQLEQASQAAQLDLAKMRIERWKADGGSKRQAQQNVESIERNLQEALPGMITELRTSPESLPTSFKLYRNLDALYDVFGAVVESAGAWGSKDEFQSLENDLSAFEKSRHGFADRMESLASAKEMELARLRSEARSAQAATSSATPKKVIVDDTEPVKPAKKVVKKKPAAKSAEPATPGAATTPAPTPPPKSQ